MGGMAEGGAPEAGGVATPGWGVASGGEGLPAMGEGCDGPMGEGVVGGAWVSGTAGGANGEVGGAWLLEEGGMGLPGNGLAPGPKGTATGAKGERGGMAVLLAEKVGLPEKTVAFAPLGWGVWAKEMAASKSKIRSAGKTGKRECFITKAEIKVAKRPPIQSLGQIDERRNPPGMG